MTPSILTPALGPVALRHAMVSPPIGMGVFEFVALTALRAAQLLRGCVPTVETGGHKPTTVAQMEVSSGRIRSAETVPVPATEI